MSPEDQKMFDDYFDLFCLDGWKRLEEDLTASTKSLETVYNVKDMESLWHAKGKLEALNNLITFRDTINLMYEDMRDQDVA